MWFQKTCFSKFLVKFLINVFLKFYCFKIWKIKKNNKNAKNVQKLKKNLKRRLLHPRHAAFITSENDIITFMWSSRSDLDRCSRHRGQNNCGLVTNMQCALCNEMKTMLTFPVLTVTPKTSLEAKLYVCLSISTRDSLAHTKRVLAVAEASVCLSVRPSVTLL